MVIDNSCPVIVLDDVREELWEISHGLTVCGLSIMPHLIIDGQLEWMPVRPHEGVRLLFTDLHVLGPTQSRPEQYISALVGFIKKLISPATYLIVFWSAYPGEAEVAWDLLISRLKVIGAENLIPFGYRVLDKADVKNISDDDKSVSAKAAEIVRESIGRILDEFPQLRSFMHWEACLSRAASATSNELIGRLGQGGIEFTNGVAIRDTLKRMSQEALGLPHAPNAPTKGVYQALVPIAQDWLNKESDKGGLDHFLELKETDAVKLPPAAEGKPSLMSLLNDFFIHSETPGLKASERGVVIRLSPDFLAREQHGLVNEIGMSEKAGDWRTSICTEFAHDFFGASPENQEKFRQKLDPKNVYAVELSADCDYAQDKTRTHRFLVSLFVPSVDPKPFYQNSRAANGAVYLTPEINLEGVPGRLLISCRIFLTRPYKGAVEGKVVTRIRPEVLSELSHHYTTHMRRPGKIAFLR